jgi:hypothetical protein
MDFQGRVVKSRFQAFLAALPAMNGIAPRGWWHGYALTASLTMFSAALWRAISLPFEATVAFAAGLARSISRRFQAALEGLAAMVARWLKLPTPPDRIAVVDHENRFFGVPQELRVTTVEYEQRVVAA